MAASTSEAEANIDEYQPINFGKRLAHTDKVIRDRGFRTLKKWLQKHPDLERLDFMKLWKGLYFGVWMADKRPIQQELAVNIALLLPEVPRAKQAMWMDCFWETMQASWEKLDIHRISKYLQFIRIVIAEAFKAMRVAGWPLKEMRELGNTFTRLTPMKAKVGNNAPSMGLLLQFTRIVWEELRPQLEAGATSKKALLALVEPFCVLAEVSAIESLVRHIHEYIFKKAPQELLTSLIERILAGASRPEVPKKNRQALYDTVDVLERVARSELPKGVKPLKLVGVSPACTKVSSPLASLPPLELPPSLTPLPAAQGKKKKGKKRKKATGPGVSPLTLPEAQLPVPESHEVNSPKITAQKEETRKVKRKKLKR